MTKVAIFAFTGELSCFVHVLLNALDMKARGYDVRIVLEGSATKLVPELARPGNALFQWYQQAKDQGLIDAVCRACSTANGVLEAVEAEELPIVDEMKGHPSMARYRDAGYEIVTL